MTENVLKQLQEQDLLLLAIKAVDDYMELSKGSDFGAIEKKRDELYLLNKVIKEKHIVGARQNSANLS